MLAATFLAISSTVAVKGHGLCVPRCAVSLPFQIDECGRAHQLAGQLRDSPNGPRLAASTPAAIDGSDSQPSNWGLDSSVVFGRLEADACRNVLAISSTVAVKGTGYAFLLCGAFRSRF